ncbi:tetraspanin-36-like [Phascolarctos cinereus]|uniref:Tetraspanin n=1 Tax=Phascolarctos cinereus TaxID=38626 RepID=A0A6P5J3N8_PHACI|nr:tetraspanin-3-like [Phascolarctos cinereus]XP_020827975.1 tetraspanin-3-like [Phascolarctos cinereus]
MLAPSPIVTMDCGMITSKTVLLLLSIIFLAAGATLGFVGGRFISSFEDFDAFFRDEQILLPAIIIIIVAGVMLFLGVTGCFVTIKESQIGLRLFLAILLLMFITEAAAFVLGFIYREKVVAEVQENMDELFQTYGKEKPETEMVDFWQSQFRCCGVKNYTDWVNRDWFNRTGNNSVPQSCCKQEFKNCSGLLSEPQELNTVGCAGLMELRIKELINYIMIVILRFAVVKFFGMLSILVITCRQEENAYQPLNSGVFA